jgi:predicted lipoprotein with Yx(FWY)xxD motif
MIGSLRARAPALGVSTVAAAILLSACGNGAGYGSRTAAPPPASSAPYPAPTSAPATNGASLIGTRSIPGIGTVLNNVKGLTLYHLTTDTSTRTTCSGGCAQVWPPLLATKGVPESSPGVTGVFGTIERPDGGVQVTFNGMPLYTYSGDSRPGQATGQGIGGVWFAVTS